MSSPEAASSDTIFETTSPGDNTPHHVTNVDQDSVQEPSKSDAEDCIARPDWTHLLPADIDDGDSASTSGALERIAEEAWRILKLAGPLSVFSIFRGLSATMDVIAVGHLSRHDLSSAVLGTSLCGVFGMSIMVGISSAMETLCGQAFGAKHYKIVGTIYQRALLICFVFVLLFVAPLWLNMGRLLLWAGQDATIAAGTAIFIKWTLPAVFAMLLGQCTARYLMVQGIVFPSSAAGVLSTVMCPFYLWFFLYKLKLGLVGAALAYDGTAMTSSAVLVGCAIRRTWQQKGTAVATWPGLTLDAFKGWGQYMRLALPCVAMIAVETVAFQGLIIMAGYLAAPDRNVAAMGITFNLCGLAFMVSYGIAGAASTRVSNELGAGRPEAGRTIVITTSIMGTLTGGLIAVVYTVLRSRLGPLFTVDGLVQSSVASLTPILAAMVMGDAWNCVFSGILRGCGRQSWGAALNITFFWGMGLPLAWFLGFKAGYGVQGLWSGISIVTTLLGIVLGCICFSLNWDVEAERAFAAIKEAHASAATEVEFSRVAQEEPEP